MNCDRFSQYIDDLVDGELNQTIKAECEEHMQSCPSCKQMYDDYVFMLTSLKDFGNLEKSDITFPSNLHDSIMSAVLNSVNDDTDVSTEKSKSESTTQINVENNVNSGTILNIENIVANNETSSDNIIDITKATNVSNDKKDTKDAKDANERSFYQKYGSTLVAGVVSVFVATGAYQTYQHLLSPTVAQTPMLTIEAENSETAEISEYSSETPAENVDVLNATDVELNGFSEEITDQANRKGTESIENVEVSDNQNTSSDSSKSVSNDNSVTAEANSASPSTQPTTYGTQPAQPSMAASPRAQAAPVSTLPEIKISVNCDDLEAYVNYLSSSPDFTLEQSTSSNGAIQVTGSTTDFDKFIKFAKDYSEIENPNIEVEYSDEALAKINETQKFSFTVQQH